MGVKDRLEQFLDQEILRYPRVDWLQCLIKGEKIAFKIHHLKWKKSSDWSKWLTHEDLTAESVAGELRALIGAEHWSEGPIDYPLPDPSR